MTKHPWDREPNESAKAYAAFVVYRDMGLERSIQKVAQKCAKSCSLLKRWSSDYAWVDRAWDYDRHLQELRLRAAEQDIIKNQESKTTTSNYWLTGIFKRMKSITPEQMDSMLANLTPLQLFNFTQQVIQYKEEGIVMSNPGLIAAMNPDKPKETWQPIKYIEFKLQERHKEDLAQLNDDTLKEPPRTEA